MSAKTDLLAEFMTEGELAAELGKTIRTLQMWREHRKGPPFVRLGRQTLYRRDSVIGWLKANEQQPARSRTRAA